MACMLIAIIAIYISEIFRSDIVSLIITSAVIAAGLIFPPLSLAVPCCFYSLVNCENRLPSKASLICRGIAGACSVILISVCDQTLFSKASAILICGLSCYIAWRTAKAEQKEKEMTARYDAARSSAIDAGRLSKEITKNADNEIYMARLKERNRIAREIHDNVGHMITRVIVQMQAIKIINRDDNVGKQLDSVSETLDLAMTGIRKSVHELHDDSIDLSIGINDIVKVIEDRFDVTAETSIESPADNELKSNILGIVKEAVTNIAKYSKGDKVEISLVENVTFWRLRIFDNGRNEEREIFLGGEDVSSLSGGGIGLQNIGARARAMDGRATVKSGRDGFTVLVTIPKERNRS